MALHSWLIYLVAVIGLSITPGPNTLLALTHGALHGHRKALCTIAGGAVGFIALIALSMLGISALLKAWGPALTVLKWAGGAYLIWLGIRYLRGARTSLSAPRKPPASTARKALRDSLVVEAVNPKSALFYLAFLPQFIAPADPVLPAGAGGSSETMHIGAGWYRNGGDSQVLSVRLATTSTVMMNISGTTGTLTGQFGSGDWTAIRISGTYLTSAPLDTSTA